MLNPDPDFEEIRYQDEGSYEFVMKYLKSFKERGITKADPRYSRWLHRAVKQTFYCSSEEVSVLYRFALEWEEPAVLCAILPSKFMRLDHGVETLSKPLEMFGFEQVRPGSVICHCTAKHTLIQFLALMSPLRAWIRLNSA